MKQGDAPPPRDEIADSDELAEVREALDGLRRELRARFHRGESDDDALRRIDWNEVFVSLRRRRRDARHVGALRRGGRVRHGRGGAPAHAPLLDLLYERYWRVDLGGLANLPEKGPCLLVANHSGLLPYDGLMLAHAIERRHPSGERPRFFVADWLMTLPFVQPYLARLGGVRACRENAERLLRAGRFVLVFPEGVKGAAKVFRERYRLKRFGRGGVIRVALETGAPLVPVGIVGAEERIPSSSSGGRRCASACRSCR